MSSKIVAIERAAALVPDGAVLAVSSSSGRNTPDAFLAALGARCRTEGRPGGLTVVMPIAAGDMYGIKGIDHLAQRGMLTRVIAGSYPSGPSSFEPPRIRQMIAGEEVAAWNLPSGVLFDMLRDVAAKRAGVLTKVGLGTFVDPRLEGGRMNARRGPTSCASSSSAARSGCTCRTSCPTSASSAERPRTRTATCPWSTKAPTWAPSTSRSPCATPAAW
jgi:acyl CoA:acetate/3-ketoacid CoA transferase